MKKELPNHQQFLLLTLFLHPRNNQWAIDRRNRYHHTVQPQGGRRQLSRQVVHLNNGV